MSRSYKKPWVVDQSSKYWGKRWAARKIRRLDTDELCDGSIYKKFYNPWDICDFKWLVDKNNEDYKKVQRK